ncbi:MAG: fructuronate reductase [Ewingella americana]|jgi:fructuronate reductase|uniref:mannitol dehydrogenase family protein n=1 Tax=Ewingella americana TaxID=41202 RepID=UPI00242AFCF2|nr:fructuronate reductase [Ewingella americana]MCI1677751.1 fructuronate reductase [Ewingella americana]MCI1852560.1 fructuronate reductase [Ewingella americana]MCI1863833.1 fructuronate reductase [Ewingella americana]MCI2142161.1 fructuronate reductase [Ewingella americana]MCI2165292.1 fructuronate reductase [Ewingella americana]
MKTIATEQLPAQVQLPNYDRDQLKSRIVHIGFGAFHRAHQALMTDRVLNKQGGDWGICEVSLFGRDNLIKALRQQDNLFTVLEKGAEGDQAIVIGAVCETLHGRIEGINAVVEKLAEPQVAIVSLTITEKGYCIEPGSGKLDLDNPQIQQDLTGEQTPSTAPGILVEALRLRHQRGLPGFSVLSCDNIPENGHVVKNAVLGLAQARSAELAAWIESHVTFPSTMVDRIVPAATENALDEITEALGGVADPCGIACEPFIQWVVEDNFVAGRPAWEEVGAQLVSDVLPFEQMKLRMLNGSHSFLAYLGYLAGYQYINECMEDPNYKRAAHNLMLKEQAPTLSVKGINLQDYADSLIARYSNPSLKHRTWQIAMDGTMKLPQRMLDSVRWHLQNGGDFSLLALGVAGWMRYVGGVDDAGAVIEIKDPMAEKLAQIVSNSEDGEARVNALLALHSVFGDALAKNAQAVEAIQQAYASLQQHGAKQSVANYVG